MTELDMVIKAAERAATDLYKKATETGENPISNFGYAHGAMVFAKLRAELERVRAEEMS